MRLPAILAFALLLLAAPRSFAADLRVYTSGAPAQIVVGASFSAATGHRVLVTFATIAAIRQKLSATPAPDVVILPAPVMDALDKTGMFAGGSRTELARVGIGVAVRAGAPLPDISTEDAVRKVLIDARSIVHPDPAGGGFAGAQIARMMVRLGIANLVKPKTSYKFAISGGTAVVASGEADIGLFNVSEILVDKGVTLVGPLPPSLQSYITFVGAVYAGSAEPDAARAFLRALTARDARDTWTKAGLEPL